MAHDLMAVNSSAVSHIGFANGVLTVQWKHKGKITRYLGVPGRLWEQLQGSDSKGRFIATQIKGKYQEA